MRPPAVRHGLVLALGVALVEGCTFSGPDRLDEGPVAAADRPCDDGSGAVAAETPAYILGPSVLGAGLLVVGAVAITLADVVILPVSWYEGEPFVIWNTVLDRVRDQPSTEPQLPERTPATEPAAPGAPPAWWHGPAPVNSSSWHAPSQPYRSTDR